MQSRQHTLTEYLEAFEQAGLVKEVSLGTVSSQREVMLVTYDSRKTEPGALFFCKGVHYNVSYLETALQKGAFAYVSERRELSDPEDAVPRILVNDIRKAMAIAANLYFDEAWRSFTLIGITGSKGKSTTTFFTKDILDDFLADRKLPPCGVMSSIENFDGLVREDESLNTTKEAFPLHRHFANGREAGIRYMVTEVSSQGLKYHRTLGVNYDIGVYMNIGRDHISPAEHPDMEDYISSKELLFDQCSAACIHLDTPYSERFLVRAQNSRTVGKILTFGQREGCDVYGYDIRTSLEGITFRAKGPDFDEEFSIGLTGLFNVINALAAISICTLAGIPMEFIKSGLRRSRVSGRMELFFSPSKKKFVIMDYAHTFDSFTLLLQSTKTEYPGKKIIMVFGSAGNKAESRRKDLPEAAAPYVEKMIITMEDPGEEDPLAICEEIAGFGREAGGICEIIVDRHEAIRKAISEADEDTIVIITGKGWETRHRIGTEYVKTVSDGETIVEALKEYK